MVGEIKPTSNARFDIFKQTVPQTDIGSFKDVISLACKHEHEQRNKTKSFFKYFSNMDKIFKKYFVTLRIEYLVMWKNILPCITDE
jgi:hypothetical protein